MSDEENAIRQAAAAGAERTELMVEQDLLLLDAVTELRTRLASGQLTEGELQAAGKLVDEWGALVDQRLALAAREADTVGKIIAELAPFGRQWVSVLRDQTARLRSLALTVGVMVAILDAGDELAERLLPGRSDGG